jgi:hypothetical protein
MQVRNESPVTTDVGVVRPPAAPPDGTGAPPDRAVSRVVLDVSDADVFLKSAGPGESMRLEASYDEKSFALDESQGTDDAGALVWKIGFRKTSPFAWTALRTLFGGKKPSVNLWVPPGLPVALEGRVAKGAIQGEVDRIALRSVDLEVQRGAMVLEFEEPMDEPMDRFAARCNQGALVVIGLGHASPRTATFTTAMGGGVIDLRGEWLRDADITIDSNLGGGSLQLPEGVIIEGLEGYTGLHGGHEPEIAPPTLRFTVTQRRGEWEVER